MIDLSWPYWQVVLILVLVDVGLGPPSHRTGDPVACVVLILVLVDVGLGPANPMFTVDDLKAVLILVLVDVGLGRLLEMELKTLIKSCLNPCFSGCWSRTANTEDTRREPLLS